MHFAILIFALTKVSPTDIAAIVTALGGIFVGILTARRGSKNDKAGQDQTARQSLLEGYGQMVKDLQGEIERIRKQYQEDLTRWIQEKQTLESEKAIIFKQLELLQETLQNPKTARKPRKKVTDEEDIPPDK